ncbi:MAG: DoxX family protein [Bryobacterales bacterium]|nr:DoxX family protein [Bryobacterales bacterium]
MNWQSCTHALLRIVTGFMIMPHGYQKLFGFGGVGPREGALPTTAGVIELVCGAFVLVGFQTRWAAFLASGLMAAAYFMRHAGDGFWPLLNRGELAALYCFVFLYLWAHGSGEYSVDSLLKKRKG